MPEHKPTFIASNQFFYYADIAHAAHFYSKVLGLGQVADYGMARIFRLAHSSYLTLVEADKGMHSVDEPKTVTLTLITPQVGEWYTYLQSVDIPIHRPLLSPPEQANDSFVVLDPEGYFIEFERFNVHPDNSALLSTLDTLPMTHANPAQARQRVPQLDVSGVVLWTYYTNPQDAETFLQDGLGLWPIVNQKKATIFHASPSGFIGTVVSGHGLHAYTEQKAVTISLLTDSAASMQAWYARMQNRPDFQLRSQEIVERDRYHAFVGYAPGNHFLEFNYFLDHADNQLLMQMLHA